MASYLAIGPSNHAESGWLKAPFQGSKAHHFVHDDQFWGESGMVYGWSAACGHLATTTEAMPMLDAGNWPRCERSMRGK